MPRRRGTDWMQRFERHSRRTFGDAAKKYYTGLKEGSYKRRVRFALKALNPYFSSVLLMDLNDDTADPYRRERSKAVSAETVNLELNIVSTILNRACRRWEWIPRAPELSRLQGAKRVAYPLTWDEQDALFAELPELWANGLALFGINTGCRPSEIFGIRWNDLVEIPSHDTFVFLLGEQTTKNGECRAVICNSLARLAVERQKGNGSEYVFPSTCNRNRGGKRTALGMKWYDAWKRAGLPTEPWIRRGPHNLRHSFASRLGAAGVRKEAIEKLLGHARASVTDDYTMPELRYLEEQAELVTKRSDAVFLRRRVA